jgi:ribosomal protein S15P/S13E
MHMNQALVSEHMRRQNSRAVEKRDRWREKYAQITLIIKKLKQHLRAHPGDRAAQVQLKCMRFAANIMMMQRDVLSERLYDTAYVYVSVDKEAA